MEQPTQNQLTPGQGLPAPDCYAESIRRWTFETRGGEVWVCEGLHEKCESCEANSREVFAKELVEIIDALRADGLRMFYSLLGGLQNGDRIIIPTTLEHARDMYLVAFRVMEELESNSQNNPLPRRP